MVHSTVGVDLSIRLSIALLIAQRKDTPLVIREQGNSCGDENLTLLPKRKREVVFRCIMFVSHLSVEKLAVAALALVVALPVGVFEGSEQN